MAAALSTLSPTVTFNKAKLWCRGRQGDFSLESTLKCSTALLKVWKLIAVNLAAAFSSGQ